MHTEWMQQCQKYTLSYIQKWFSNYCKNWWFSGLHGMHNTWIKINLYLFWCNSNIMRSCCPLLKVRIASCGVMCLTKNKRQKRTQLTYAIFSQSEMSIKQKSSSFHVESGLLNSKQLVTFFVLVCPVRIRALWDQKQYYRERPERIIHWNVSFTLYFYIFKIPQMY